MGKFGGQVLEILLKKKSLKGYCNITKLGKENALKILERAQEILPAKISDEYEQFICDATPDEIFIEYEDGEFIFGQSVDFMSSCEDLPNFYSEIAEQVVIDNLLFCEDYDEYF